MDFEELIGVLFTLYILGSTVAGFFRRGRQAPPADGEPKGSGRPGLSEVLDMDELERRLRDLAGGRLGRQEPRVPTQPEPAPPVRPSTPASSRPSPGSTAPVRPQPGTRPVSPVPRVAVSGGDGWREMEGDWEGWTDGPWEPERSRRPSDRRPSKAASLPPAVAAYVREGNPWQAAFVVKELLGPPRALSPHRSFPRR